MKLINAIVTFSLIFPTLLGAEEKKKEGVFPIYVRGPLCVHAERPSYPEEAKKNRVSAQVVLELTLDEEAKIKDIEVLKGEPPFIDAAVSAVKKYKIDPECLKKGIIKRSFSITFNFVYNESPR
jgi:TonB family protein